MINKIGVHTRHCCKLHGCKYGNEACPVVNGDVVQAYPCEECGEYFGNGLVYGELLHDAKNGDLTEGMVFQYGERELNVDHDAIVQILALVNERWEYILDQTLLGLKG